MREKLLKQTSTTSASSSVSEEIKSCPKCSALITKANDGSCNHIRCPLCACEFCWLCMRQINDFHYLSPTGCTFWGKKRWSRKKKNVWRVGALLAAPPLIGLAAALAVPGIIIGLPIYAGVKMHKKLKHKHNLNKHMRRIAVLSTVTAVSIASPLVATLTVVVLVPVSLVGVYGLVVFSLKQDRNNDKHDAKLSSSSKTSQLTN